MARYFEALPLKPLQDGARLCRPTGHLKQWRSVTPSHSALLVMTDFNQVVPLTVHRQTSLPVTLTAMKQAGVRLLLVTGDDEELIGVITPRDIHGRKSRNIMSKTGEHLDDLKVEDVMTLRHRIDYLSLDDVCKARVGDIIETLRQVNRQHTLVGSRDAVNDTLIVTGIFSLSQIGTQLGPGFDPGAQPVTIDKLAMAAQ